MRNKSKHDRISVELVKIDGKYQVERASKPYRHAGKIEGTLEILADYFSNSDQIRPEGGPPLQRESETDRKILSRPK